MAQTLFPRRPHAAAVLALLLALTLSPAAPLQAQTSVGLPGLGDGSDMTIAAERRMGDGIARDIYRDPDYLDDPVLGDYLQSIWQPLLKGAQDRGEVPTELAERLAWELLLARDKRVNAFALPGGYMGVNLGLIAVTDTSAELASVLAHEMSHVSQRHIARMLSREAQQAPWLMGAMILGVLAARANTEVASAALAGGQAVALQSQLNFSRDMEREADRVGFGVLTGAGFNGAGFVSMFDKLQQAARLNDDGAFPYLRSHPLTSERIADMRSRIPPGVAQTAAAADPRLPAPELHALMAARAKVLAESGADRWRAWLASGQGPQARPGDLCAAALSALRLGQGPLALSLAQRLRSSVAAPARPVADLLVLEIMLAPGGPAPTDPQLLALRDQALASQSRAGVLLGAQAALATGAAQAAANRLQDWVVAHPRDATAWQTLSRAQLALNQRLRAIRSEAEARAAQLDFAGAAERFKAAQALPAAERSADPMELAIVDVRRREVDAALRESLREK